MTTPIEPQFTMTWLENKLAIMFDRAVGVVAETEDIPTAMIIASTYADALHFWGYEGETSDEIERLIWESAAYDHPFFRTDGEWV